MSSLPNEIFYNITNFLPNDDITDLMLMSRKFNGLVSWRLWKIDEEMATMNQSIQSFIPSPLCTSNDEWISQLNIKRFEPIGSVAKKRMREVFKYQNFLTLLWNTASVMRPGTLACGGFSNLWNVTYGTDSFDIIKERLSLERFDDPTFLRVFGAIVARPKFRQEYTIPDAVFWDPVHTLLRIYEKLNFKNSESYVDVLRIWAFYNPNINVKHICSLNHN